jgi:hypothetical protein
MDAQAAWAITGDRDRDITQIKHQINQMGYF